MKLGTKEVKKSREEALIKIKEYLDAEDIDSQFATVTGSYYSKDKFIVSWIGNYRGIPAEFSIDKTDSFYSTYSGYKAIYATRSLFHEKQLAGYGSIERALIDVGLKLCGKKEKVEFFKKYAVKYNEKLKQTQNHAT